MTRDEFDDAMMDLATEVACGRGAGEYARNLAGALLAIRARAATNRSAAARRAAMSRWHGSGDDAEPDATHVKRIEPASQNAYANGLERIADASENASQNASIPHANGALRNAVSSSLILQDEQETQQLPRLLSPPAPSELLPEKTSRSSNARARKLKPSPDTNIAWRAYSVAYRRRYGIDPTRNARVNGMLANFMRRVPIEDVVTIVQHYVASHNARYVASGHSIECLLKDSEKLRTEALTGRAGTATAARLEDRTAHRSGQYEQMLAQLRAEDDADERAGNGKA